MICPKCNNQVDPVTSDHWLDTLNISEFHKLSKKEKVITVLKAIRQWDQSAMFFSFEMTKDQKAQIPKNTPSFIPKDCIWGQSIMPIELRDIIFNVLSDLTDGNIDEE